MDLQPTAEDVGLVHPEIIVPIHFRTFPLLTGTKQAFGKALKSLGLQTPLKVLQDGTLNL